jgi:hypothetical protein
LVKEQLDYLK